MNTPAAAFPTTVLTPNGHEIRQDGLTKLEYIVTQLLSGSGTLLADAEYVAETVKVAQEIIKQCAGK